MSELEILAAPRPAVDPRAFRNALGSFTTGVTIVTTRDAQGRDVGLTVNSFNSVSLEPPLVLWSLARNSASLEAFVEAEYFAVHILGAQQEQLSNRFAQRGIEKFAGVEVARGLGGVPLLPGCAARFECRTAYRHEGGDHEIFVGEVLSFEHFDQAPLVFQQGGYAVAVKKPRRAQPVATPESPEGSFSRNALIYLLGSAHAMLLSLLRPALQARALADDDYFVLNVLSLGEARTVAELDALMALAGRRVEARRLQSLVAAGWVLALPGARFRLSDTGVRTMVELAAVAKGVEEDALQQIDYSEAHLLKHLLKRVIRNTARDVPALWPAPAAPSSDG
ncbi:flavin reductase family protein [Aquabacterium sp.]|uniref:flavin reductase family protein n=1 Tax=Aquabacterium sp. TaxID=1872578 RepID=UPI002BA56A92|nr:flavin reductase family protein [Aquabacterium sp.]HSW04941.1 flavin reductase family protein [Aquabacterium sp.]